MTDEMRIIIAIHFVVGRRDEFSFGFIRWGSFQREHILSTRTLLSSQAIGEFQAF